MQTHLNKDGLSVCRKEPSACRCDTRAPNPDLMKKGAQPLHELRMPRGGTCDYPRMCYEATVANTVLQEGMVCKQLPISFWGTCYYSHVTVVKALTVHQP